jgi:hypothetical protein
MYLPPYSHQNIHQLHVLHNQGHHRSKCCQKLSQLSPVHHRSSKFRQDLSQLIEPRIMMEHKCLINYYICYLPNFNSHILQRFQNIQVRVVLKL